MQRAVGMESGGTLPLIEIEPDGVSLRAIADGAQDGYISRLVREAKNLHGKVVLSFGPEINGRW